MLPMVSKIKETHGQYTVDAYKVDVDAEMRRTALQFAKDIILSDKSFPDDFIFYGNKTSICKQIGNAVPPKVSYFLARLIENILRQ